MNSILLLALFAVVALSIDLRHEFDTWKATHQKAYESEEEHTLRFKNFVESVKRIEKLNSKSNGGATFALNKYSDMAPEEFKAKYQMTRPIVSNGIHPEFEAPESFKNFQAPQTVDWRTRGVVTKVKDQEQCGSCWAFSVTETIESAWMIAKRIDNTTFKPLAPQQIVDCDQSDEGCNGGDPPTAYDYVKQAGGLEYETAYPYTAVDGTCKFNKKKAYVRISDWKYATSEYDEETLKQNLASVGPLSICVDAQYWQDYAGGVLGAWQCAWINSLDHCVQAVGYNSTSSTPYWLVRNSWGEDWGEEGYIRLAYGGNTCGLTNEATFPTV